MMFASMEGSPTISGAWIFASASTMRQARAALMEDFRVDARLCEEIAV